MGVVDLMVANKVVRPADVTQAKAAHFGAEVVNLSEVKIEDDVIAAIPRHIARKYRVVPVFKHDNSITVALADPSDLDTIDSLTHLLHAEIDLRVASEADIEAALSKYYAERGGGVAADPRLKEAIEDLTREHVEVEAAAMDGRRGGGGGCAAHQAGQFDHRRGVQDARFGHSPGAAVEDVPHALPD